MTLEASLARRERIPLGIALIVGSVFLMSLQDAIVKYASTDLSLWQIYVLRSAIAAPALVAILYRRSRGGMPPAAGADRWVVLRSTLLVLMYVALYAAVPVLSLSTIAAAFYTGPLFITVLSGLLIGEPVGRRGWLAVAVGFAGVLVILRPGSDAFSPVALLPVLSGLFYALAAVVTRGRCQATPPVALALALNGALFVAGAVASLAILIWQPTAAQAAVYPFLLDGWSTMGAGEWTFVCVLAALMVAIGVGLAAAYQSAPPALIATFDYSYLIFAALWGYALFSDAPDVATVTGMVLIAGAGLLAVRRRAG